MGTLPRLDLMRQYPVKITNIQVDVTFIIPKLIDGVPSHAKIAYRLKWPGIVKLVANGEELPHMWGKENHAAKGFGRGEAQPNKDVI